MITHQRVREAYNRGYRVNEKGLLIGVKGFPLTLKLYGKQRYPTFSTNWDKRVFGIPVHIFAAYCFYGERVFDSSLVVRHLNGDTLDISKNNIILGTHSENNRDKNEETRKYAAKKARESQGIIPLNAKLSKEAVDKIRKFYKELNGRKAPNGTVTSLAKSLGVTKSTLHLVKKGKYYASYSS